MTCPRSGDIGATIRGMESTPRVCRICGADISDKRPQAIYCGDTCKKRAQRAGIATPRFPRESFERIQPAAKPKRMRALSADDLAALIVESESLEQAFRFASTKAERRFRPMCLRIADSIRGALTDEGLT